MLKKSLAIAGSLLLVTLNLLVGVVHAGALNGLTASYSSTGESVTIGYSTWFTSAQPNVTYSIEKCVVGDSCFTVTSWTITDSDTTTGVIVITGSALKNLTGGNYTVRFTTSDGDFGAATFVIGDANKVTLTAKVLPILLFNVSTNSLDFGTLTPTAVTTWDFNVTLSTNAANGATIHMQVTGTGSDAGLYDSVSNHLIKAWTGDVTAWTEGMKIYVSHIDTPAAGASLSTGSFAGIVNNSETDILSVDKPTDTAKATIETDVAISNITPAGNYQTTYTLTVTANF